MLFSDRIGATRPNETIQIDSVDEKLKNHLWNALELFYWRQSDSKYMVFDGVYGRRMKNKLYPLINIIWNNYLNYRLDQMSLLIDENIDTILKKAFRSEWYEVYNFLEFIAQNEIDNGYKKEFMDYCNTFLEKDMSGYRFVDGLITPITSKAEIDSIESAFQNTDRYTNVKQHLKQAQNLFSKRPDPDYRNSIKESISAVEALCCIVCGKENATLGEAINLMKRQSFPMHQAFVNALSNLYGYTSDSDGIRHHLHDEEHLCAADAKFMLVICSAFVNYVIEIKSMEKVK